MTTEALTPAAAEAAVVTGGGGEIVLPQVIVDAGPSAVARFLEFFGARIANARTRAAYGRAVGQFLGWCEARGLGLHVAACIRVLPVNPAAAVRGPKHVVTKGATPVLSPAEARKLLETIDTGALAGVRDRALLSVMLYSFARVSAVLGMRRQDYFGQGSRGWLRLHEKGGKRHDVPAHHRAAAALDAGRLEEPKVALFQKDRRPGGAAADGPGARAAGRPGDDQAAGRGRGAAALDVLPHVPGDGDHGVPVERGDAGARAADRGARVAQDDEALRPDGGHGDRRRDRTHRDLMRDSSRHVAPASRASPRTGRVDQFPQGRVVRSLARRQQLQAHRRGAVPGTLRRPRRTADHVSQTTVCDTTVPSRWTFSAAPCRRPASTRSTSTTTAPLASATTGRDSLVVWKRDRLGRNLAHLVNTVQRVLAGQGAQVDTTIPRPAASCSAASSPRWPRVRRTGAAVPGLQSAPTTESSLWIYIRRFFGGQFSVSPGGSVFGVA